MIELIKNFLGFPKPKYLITVEFKKFNKKYIRSRKQTNSNDTFIQGIFEGNNPDSILIDVKKEILKKFPHSENHRITSIIKF